MRAASMNRNVTPLLVFMVTGVFTLVFRNTRDVRIRIFLQKNKLRQFY
jgi:hypothetical protein